MACVLWGSVMAGTHADATSPEANGAGKWTVTGARDPLLDTPSIIATLLATPVPGKPELRPSLRVACTNGLLSTSIRWGTGTKGGPDRCKRTKEAVVLIGSTV